MLFVDGSPVINSKLGVTSLKYGVVKNDLVGYEIDQVIILWMIPPHASPAQRE
jgi:hypothetical protein